MLRHQRAIAVGPEARIAKPEGILLSPHETAHEFIGLRLLPGRVPLITIGDFDLAGALPLVEIRHRGAQRQRARSASKALPVTQRHRSLFSRPALK
jgi:hypothetical protein